MSHEQMGERMSIIQAQYPWLVCLLQDELVGYAYAAPWKERSAFRFSVESTVYVKDGHFGCGYGLKLYEQLLDELQQRSFHSVVGGITLPNDASISLHEKLGFNKVAHFKNVGNKFGEWLDVGYWQLELPVYK